MKIAVEIDGSKVRSPVDLEPPYGTKIHHGAEAEREAEKELSGGRKSYRKPASAFYAIFEWTKPRGEVGRLIDWLEGGDIPVTRYAEIT